MVIEPTNPTFKTKSLGKIFEFADLNPFGAEEFAYAVGSQLYRRPNGLRVIKRLSGKVRGPLDVVCLAIVVLDVLLVRLVLVVIRRGWLLVASFLLGCLVGAVLGRLLSIRLLLAL